MLFETLKKNSRFFICYTLFLVAGGVLQLLYSQEELFLIINSKNSPLADFFFYWITHLGDGLVFIILFVGLIFYRYRLALLGFLMFAFTSIVAQVLKRGFFEDAFRPIVTLGEKYNLHIVEGVVPVVWYSFPSGHTVSAFALALFLVVAFNLKKTGWLLCFMAIVIGYSRVYLVHHFFEDIYFGSIIGVVVGLGVYLIANRKLQTRFGDNKLGKNEN